MLRLARGFCWVHESMSKDNPNKNGVCFFAGKTHGLAMFELGIPKSTSQCAEELTQLLSPRDPNQKKNVYGSPRRARKKHVFKTGAVYDGP